MFYKEISKNEHGIPIGKEPITLPEGLFVSRQNPVPSGKSAYQHEEGRLRLVKVGEKNIDRFKFVARGNEYSGFIRFVFKCSIVLGGRLEGPDHRRSDGHDPSILILGLPHG